jgi:hypothetical protein
MDIRTLHLMNRILREISDPKFTPHLVSISLTMDARSKGFPFFAVAMLREPDVLLFSPARLCSTGDTQPFSHGDTAATAPLNFMSGNEVWSHRGVWDLEARAKCRAPPSF